MVPVFMVKAMSTDSRAIEQRAHSSGKSSLPPPGPPPPTPSFIFRGHDASIQALEFFASNTFLVSGDQEGWICVWDIWKRRQVYKWQGHPSSSILAFKVIPFYKALSSSGDLGVSHRKLGALEKQVYIVSHGRDNEIHVWDINTILQKSLRLVDSTAIGGMTVGKDDLTLVYSLPVNALNFCKMSILAIEISAPQLQQQQQQQQQKQKVGQDQERSQENESSSSTLSRTHHHIYIAVPSPMTPSLIDVYDIVRPERAFVSIGSDSGNPGSGHDMFGKKWGSAMAIQLIQKRTESLDLSSLDLNDHSSARMNAMDSESRHESGTLCMLVGYEDGLVILFQEQAPMSSTSGQKISGQASKQNRKMNVLWSIKCHREPVLALDISSDLRFAVSSGADNMLVKYELFTRLQGIPEVTKVALKANGIADIKIRNDNKILGLAGWDGR
ncbi:ASTRA complex subunit [Modicella reniformis]|uniref:ASTRA-associated protein 1 n=1 Tax=Modicella reniformis TaxID=1440133 RepID=A0A9P6J100_9FUNG|nr:ASTRA complex subunit [Modicella reniformis]